MFYYVSFLRPPPSVCSPSEHVLITPQISNDLRTEYLDDPVDLYYAWSLHDPRQTAPTLTKPAKLTSWRPGAAYKEIAVPRPPPLSHTDGNPDVGPGPAWRLLLACGPTPDDHLVPFGETTGRTPFAASSMPVRFPASRAPPGSGKPKGKPTKQERLVRSYALRDPPIVFDVVEQTSFDLDKKVWDGGIGLSAWLVQFFGARDAETDRELSGLRDALFGVDARHVLELGAGTGIVAITLAVLRSTLDLADPGSIVATDLPSAMPVLEANLSSNHALTSKCVPQAAVLDWEREDLSPPVQVQLDAGLDVVVMADVTYNTASFPALVGTLARLCQLCKQKRDGRPPSVVMGYKERHPDERSLWDRAKDIGLDFRQIARIDGAGGNPVEIWLA